jgi:hypothetical protein
VSIALHYNTLDIVLTNMQAFTHIAAFFCATALSERGSRGRRSSLLLVPFMSANELPLRRMSISMLEIQLTNCCGNQKVAPWTLIMLSVGCGSFVVA